MPLIKQFELLTERNDYSSLEKKLRAVAHSQLLEEIQIDEDELGLRMLFLFNNAYRYEIHYIDKGFINVIGKGKSKTTHRPNGIAYDRMYDRGKMAIKELREEADAATAVSRVVDYLMKNEVE